ncbi:MAG: sigma-70 family RNA polymerase sigma factor [Acidobacteriota bacterium]
MEIWRTHGPELFHKCLFWMSGRVDEAEEAFSRAGVLAFRKYRPETVENPSGWLRGLTRNVCMDLHRERQRESARGQLDSTTLDSIPNPSWSSEFANPEQIYLRSEMESYLRASVQELPMRLRLVMEPFLYEGCSYREIADRLSITNVALRKRVQQAREAVRGSLAQYQAGEGRLPANGKMSSCHPEIFPTPADHPGCGSLPRPRHVFAVAFRLPSGLEKDLVLYLPSPPKRFSSRRLESLERYVRRHPTGWKKRLELARHFRQTGHLDQSVPHYRFVVERYPLELSAWLELAGVYRSLGRIEEATEFHEKACRVARSKACRAHLRGLAALCRQSWDEAFEAFQRAVGQEPENSSHRIALGRAFLRAGRVLQAVEAFEAALRQEGDDSLALTFCHDALLEAGRRLGALERIRRAVELDPSNVLALQRLVDHRSKASQLTGEAGQQTRKMLRRLRRLASRRAETWRSVARLRLAQGNWKKAEGTMADFLDTHRRHSRGWLYYGEILRETGKSREAKEAIRKAFELDPHDRTIRFAYCAWMSRSVPGRQLVGLIERTLELFPHDPRTARMAALALRQIPGCGRRVEKWIEEAIRLQPDLPDSFFCRARVLMSWGRDLEAILAFEKGWALLPEGDSFEQAAQVALEIGRCWSRQGERRHSRTWFRAACRHAEALRRLDPGEAQALQEAALAALGG